VVAAFPLVPFVGWVTGALAAAVALLLAPRLPELPLAAVLLDVGDGLMVHGDRERRLQAMHDHSAGVGGVGFVLFTYLVAFASLAALAVQLEPRGWAYLPLALVVAEVLSRMPFVMLAWAGAPSHSGLGAFFMDGFNLPQLLAGVFAAAPVVAAGLWLGWLPILLAAVAVLLVALFFLETASRHFGGIGGDVFGASQEVGRAAALLALTLGVGCSGG
jgi:adenosylcobinamide-GDP ribazoletransferase